MKVQIKIKYKENTTSLEKLEVGDWIDLAISETVNLRKNEIHYLPLGVAMQLPTDYEAIVIPRSSTAKKFGLLQANSVGLIDETYKGDDDYWLFPVYTTRDVVIPKGTRLCQFRIQKHQPDIEFIVCDKFDEENRGGIGSTGN